MRIKQNVKVFSIVSALYYKDYFLEKQKKMQKKNLSQKTEVAFVQEHLCFAQTHVFLNKNAYFMQNSNILLVLGAKYIFAMEYAFLLIALLRKKSLLCYAGGKNRSWQKVHILFEEYMIYRSIHYILIPYHTLLFFEWIL